jgi:hypothetical protein
MAGTTEGDGTMKRWKRLTIFRIALALTAVAAIMPVTAQAKPTPSDNPVLNTSQPAVLGSDDRPLSKAAPQAQVSVVQSPDDRAVSRATSLDTTPIVVDDGASSIDVGMSAAMGLFLVLFAVAGTALLIRHNRKEKLSPA